MNTKMDRLVWGQASRLAGHIRIYGEEEIDGL